MQTIQVRATQNVFIKEAMVNVGDRMNAFTELMMAVSVLFYDFALDVFINAQEGCQPPLLNIEAKKVINDFNLLISLS